MIPNPLKLSQWNSDPPTVYSLLKSYVNFANDEPVKVTDLAKAGRTAFFDFEYPLTNLVSKEDFECMILNQFIMRRIGYETVTAFKIALNVRLNEIMPTYNKLFDALDGWSLFDGESTERDLSRINTNKDITDNNAISDGTINDTSDRRFSNTPQNKISQVQDGSYVSEYNYDQNNNSTHTATTTNTTVNSNGTGTEHEIVHHTLADKIGVYETFLKNKTHIYSMIFEDLEQLFYQVA